jgi:hypothetical protein
MEPAVLPPGITWEDNPEDLTDTPLTMAQALAVLAGLGYSENLAHLAVDNAPGGGGKLARHEVVIEDGGYVITTRRARWPEIGDGWDVAEICAALVIVDAHLDEAAPEIYRMDHPAARLANRWRRIAAGPWSERAEATDALNLATGGNPRKPVGPEEDITRELGDYAVAALLSIQSETKDADATWGVFIAALVKALGRVPRERPAPES